MDPSSFDIDELPSVDQRPGESVENSLRRVMVTGAAITLPVLVTLIVLGFVLNFISNLLAPLVGFLQGMGVATDLPQVVVQAAALVVLVALVFVVGLVGTNRKAERVGDTVEAVIEGIPGVGSVYTSFNRMSEVLLDSDSQSFQEVKLVEFPHEGAYVLAFLTAEAPEPIEDAAGEGAMLTLFVPLAPNPVMGGFLVSMPASDVHDVDMTVEEGVRAIMTSGVAVGDVAPAGLSPAEMADLSEAPDAPNPIPRADADRVDAYARSMGATFARTPADVADRRNDGHGNASGKRDGDEGPDE